MFTNVTVLLIMITLSSVAAQTFQYSRGWTNGKRNGKEEPRIEKFLSPCQMHKLKYLLDGKPLTDKLLTPCEYLEEESDEPRRHKLKLVEESLYDAFQ